MSAAYARKSILDRIDRTITDSSSKDRDGELLKQLFSADYYAPEFRYVKEKLESKYDFKFKEARRRSDSIEQWNKFSCVKTGNMKSHTPKLKILKDNNWGNSCKDELSPTQALQRFNDLKAKERRQRLLEEVRNVELLW